MGGLEELGISRSAFRKIYEENHGFDDNFQENHPLAPEHDDFFEFLDSGATKLVKENAELVVNIIESKVN